MEEKNKEVEIDLLELAHKLWDNKKFIIKVTIIGAIIGVIIAFSIPKQYTVSVVFTATSRDARVNNMGALASIAGINLGNLNSTDILPPTLYPNIVNSTPFIEGLLYIRVFDSTQNIDTTLYSYLNDYQKNAWWGNLLRLPISLLEKIKNKEAKIYSTKDNKSYSISEEKLSVMNALKGLYFVEYDNKTGIITLEVITQSPAISALLADTVTSYLQTYIIEQRTKKAKDDLVNTEKLYGQAKESYYNAQQRLASFVDSNQNLISARYRTNQEKLQNEVNLAYTVYTQMAQQVQVNIIKVQDETPVFTIIQPAIEPINPSAPSKKMILFMFVFLSFTFSALWLLRKDLFNLLN